MLLTALNILLSSSRLGASTFTQSAEVFVSAAGYPEVVLTITGIVVEVVVVVIVVV